MQTARLLFLFAFLFFGFNTNVQPTSADDWFSSAAPEQCWIYSSWKAQGNYELSSKNSAERILAEPAVKAFVDDVIKRIGLMGPAMADDNVQQRERLLSVSPKLTSVMLRRAGCFFLEEAPIDPENGFKGLKAAMLLDAGDEASELASELAQLITKKDQRPEQVSLQGITFEKFIMSDEAKLELLIGSNEGKLMVGVGESVLDKMITRINRNAVPKWRKDFKSDQHINRVTSIGYFNVKAIRNAYLPMMGPEAEMALGVVGLANVDSIETCSGFSETEAASRMLIRTDGRPEGLFDLSSAQGLSSAELQRFPKDALFAFGMSLDSGRLMRFFSMGPLQREFGQFMIEFKRETGVDLKADFVDNLGKSWTLHNGAGDGWFTGLTLMGTVKDGPKLRAGINKLIKRVLIETARFPEGPRFVKKSVDGNDVFTVRTSEFFFPIEPSWCITDEQVIVGLYPQTVESALTMSADASLIDQAEYEFLTQPFSGEMENTKLLAMAYTDTATQFEITYPYLQAMAVGSKSMFGSRRMRRDMSEPAIQLISGLRLPPARVIHRHLQPSFGAVRQTDAGIEFETRQSIPSIDASFITPVAVGMLLPAVQSVRLSARRTVSANNMRQHVLAALNYESAFRHFPAGYSVDPQGKKLLSWRVHILPFIEQNNLYQQFRLDEPWDSPHNKPLIEKMPEIFRSPVSKAKKGMTVYRGIGGKSGALGPPRRGNGNRGIGFGDVTDGTSNTIFLVETSDDLAIAWTKPDEGLDPNDFDLSKIFGLYPDGTNIARCDGSVEFISDKIEKDIFKILMQMNDGEIVPRMDELDREDRWGEEKETNTDPAFMIDNGEVELKLENMLNEADKKLLMEQKNRDLFRSVLLSFHNFESAYRKFPSAYTTNEQGNPLLSWRVHLLPFLEEQQLYDQFRLDEPWDSDHNRKLLKQMPDCFRLGDDSEQSRAGKTTVLAIGGKNGVISKPRDNVTGSRSMRGIGFANILDGTSNTIILIKASDDLAVEWTKPSEFVPDDDTLKKLLKKSGLMVGLGDGSSHTLDEGFSFETFKAMMTRAGGEDVGEWYRKVRRR